MGCLQSPEDGGTPEVKSGAGRYGLQPKSWRQIWVDLLRPPGGALDIFPSGL